MTVMAMGLSLDALRDATSSALRVSAMRGWFSCLQR
jgi:hypothetical protein